MSRQTLYYYCERGREERSAPYYRYEREVDLVIENARGEYVGVDFNISVSISSKVFH